MIAEVFCLSFQRPELLACTLAGVCGFNQGIGPIHVIDDGSSDSRVMALLARYKEAGLIDSVEVLPHGSPYPPGKIRRRMIDRFLDNGADMLVQIESDMLVGPSQIRVLLNAYEAVKRLEPSALHVLNVVWWKWVRHLIPPGILQVGPYRLAVTKGMSEVLWTSDRASLRHAVDSGLIPGDRPDLVLWVDSMGSATLLEPEINCQHIGAGKLSLLYDYFAWQHVTIRRDTEHRHDDGPLRQPYPFFPIEFPAFQDQYPASALQLYAELRKATEVPLPEFPNV